MSSIPAMPSSCLAVEKPRRKRVLDDKACEVCHDKSTGKHYGVYVCDGCSGFFKRSVRRSTPWVCRSNENCIVDKASRTECRACRFKKCLTVNMNPEGVQTPRGSRIVSGRKSTESDSDSNYSLRSGNTSPSSEMKGLGGVQGDEREHSGYDKDDPDTGTKFRKCAALQSNSPPLSMVVPALGRKLQNQTDQIPTIVKIETERMDGPGNDVNVTRDVDIDSTKGIEHNSRIPSNNTNVVSGQQTIAVTQSQRAQIVPFARRLTEYYESSMHSMIIPDSSFAPYGSPSFPSTSSHPRFISSDQHVHSSSGPSVASLPYSQGDSLYSMAVRLLSSVVKFAKNIPSFKLMPFRDQIILLEENWKDLFILDAAFWSLPLEVSYVMDPLEAKKETNANLVESLRVLQELVTRIQALGMDEAECAYLKTIVIFKPDIKGLKDSRQVEKLQDDTQVKFSEYVRAKSVDNPARFGRLLLTLLGFERVPQNVIEKLFFRSQNESVSVECILHDMFKST